MAEITIKKAIELRVFTSQMKQHKSIFGYKCLRLDKQLNDILLDFDNDLFEKKVEF
jgi:hypothetical protein